MLHAVEYAQSSNIKSMFSSVKSMTFIKYGKIMINLFAWVKVCYSIDRYNTIVMIIHIQWYQLWLGI